MPGTSPATTDSTRVFWDGVSRTTGKCSSRINHHDAIRAKTSEVGADENGLHCGVLSGCEERTRTTLLARPDPCTASNATSSCRRNQRSSALFLPVTRRPYERRDIVGCRRVWGFPRRHQRFAGTSDKSCSFHAAGIGAGNLQADEQKNQRATFLILSPSLRPVRSLPRVSIRSASMWDA